MAEIFRKAALERLSSPDQLDRMIVLTTPLSKLAILGGFIIVISATVWGVLGRLPQTIEANGIIRAGDQVGVTYSEVSGVVETTLVKTGDSVKKNDVIAHVYAGDVDNEMEKIMERIESVEKITLESTNDVATEDNKALIDIKRELLSLEDSYEQIKSKYDANSALLSEQIGKVSSAESDLNSKKAAYYAVIEDNSGADYQVEYSDAQTELSTAQSYEANAKATSASAKEAYSQAKADYNQTKKDYDSYSNALKKMEEDYEKLSSYNSKLEAANNQLTAETDEEKKVEIQKDIDTLSKKINSILNKYGSVDALTQSIEEYSNTVLQYKEACTTKLAARDSAKDTYNRAQEEYEKCISARKKAEKKYDTAKEKYVAFQEKASSNNKEVTIKNNEYNVALSLYSTEKNKLESYEQQDTSLKLELDSAQQQIDLKKETIADAFNSTKQSVLHNLGTEQKKMKDNLQKMDIVAQQDGVVQEVVVSDGGMVSQGSEVVKILQGDKETEEIICYIPVSNGKRVTEGMEVKLYPTTVNKQEYGHMSGSVKSVAGYITSSAEMVKKLGDQQLAESFLQSGPVIEVVCNIQKDASTVSGYQWSSKKGADLMIAEGTLFTANVVIEKKAPITLLLPYLKEKLTVKPMESEE